MQTPISNATPLITFARINQLALLQKVVGTLIIPTGVAQELTIYGQGKTGSVELAQEPWIQIRSLSSEAQVKLLLPTLDKGEAEVIALAIESKANLVLIDELTG